MGVLHDFEGWPAGPLHLGIGVFDGVHLGHRELVRRLRVDAQAAGARAVATTFDPLPIQILAPGAPPSALSDADERIALLHATGADDVVVFRFDDALRNLSARDFARGLAGAGSVRRVLVGEDFRFGHGREGNVELLRAFGAELGFEVEVMPPVAHGGEVVSSTRVRNLLLAGDVVGAATLLGRQYSVRGTIAPGGPHGRALGYPAIGVVPPAQRILPRDGIYATWVTLAAGRHPSATSLGVRATAGAGERLLESYLLDLDAEIGRGEATVAFVRRIRDELRFETPEELIQQIGRDVAATRSTLDPG